jgi:mono/diheme cytochrome c family protein
MMPAAMPRRPQLVLAALAAAGLLTACGGSDVPKSPPKSLPGKPSADVVQGAALFSERCSGCHTLDVVDAEGSATKVHDRERVDGPNFNARPQTKDGVLYAIRNGGFSGAVMPENIAVGREAEQIADFLTKYAGQVGQGGQGQQGQSAGER